MITEHEAKEKFDDVIYVLHKYTYDLRDRPSNKKLGQILADIEYDWSTRGKKSIGWEKLMWDEECDPHEQANFTDRTWRRFRCCRCHQQHRTYESYPRCVGFSGLNQRCQMCDRMVCDDCKSKRISKLYRMCRVCVKEGKDYIKANPIRP